MKLSSGRRRKVNSGQDLCVSRLVCETGGTEDIQMDRLSLSPETLAAQALGDIDLISGALTPAIHLSTNYEQQPDGSYHQDRVYTRADNPTYDHAEHLLAGLEGAGCGCILFSSGLGGATPVFQSVLLGEHGAVC